MRRMLDPKEVGGGGGDEKLYRHCVSFEKDSNRKGGYITFNYYSKKKDKFTYDTFKEEFDQNKHVACSGYIEDGNNFFTTFYIQLELADIKVRYYDAVNHMYAMTNIGWFNFEDHVSEVI